MVEMHRIFKRQIALILFLLLVCAIGWSFSPYQVVFAGLALGALCGLFNFWNLIRRMESFDRKTREGQKVKSLGTLIRYASAILAAAIAITWTEYFNVASTVIGLMIPYILLFVDRIIVHSKTK
ncbi:ATP synthase subunit I [Kurthia sibirica]|uniref:ATP synthase subunit n=1 Tax=Kurthia sibirica TaxID=202750 RepID=A0A2U3AKY3_9BACL|nr:ATP synthase subunit I [Kurthia sibirica]PWI25180.1 ATP synthase subunit [Kurthia sibirica]GEK33267.1 ATP synthase protein I [Kurthia sibirica]